MKELFEKRINALRTLISDKKEALLLSNEVNIGYFTGFFHSEGYLVLTQNSVTLFVDFRYFEAAQNKARGCKVICFQKLSESLIELFESEHIESVIGEADNLSVSRFSFFTSSACSTLTSPWLMCFCVEYVIKLKAKGCPFAVSSRIL